MPAKGKQIKSFTMGDTTFNNDLTYLGANPTNGTANDTMVFWREKGSGYAYFNALNQVNGQPSQWGFVDSFVNEGNEVNQIWRGQDGKVYIRQANSSTTAMPSWTQIAPIASPAFTGTPTAPTNGTASNSSTQIATTAFVQDAIKRRLPVSIIIGDLQTVTVATGGTAKFTNNFWTAPSNGIAIFNAQPQFAANATGIRFAGIYNVNNGIGGGFAVQAAAAGITTVNCTTIHRATSGQTFRMRYTQTSGGNLSVSGHYRIYFIPD